MTEAEFLAQLDAWALGGLSDLEAAAMARFAADASTAARSAQERAFATAALIAAAEPPSPPPPEVWDRVAARTRTGGTTAPRNRASRWQALGWIVAAAAVVLLIVALRDRARHVEREAELARALGDRDAGAATLTATRGQLDDCVRDLTVLRARDVLATEAVALLELPGTQLIPLDRKGPDATTLAANAIYHRGVKRAYVVAAGIPADAPADGYQVWLVRGGQRIAAGTLLPDHGRAIASVPTLTLDDGVPEAFQLTLASGEIVLESQIRI